MVKSYSCILFVFLFLSVYSIEEAPEKKEISEFDGVEFWDDESRDFCDNVESDTTWQWNKAICFEYLVKFQVVQMEVVAWNPGLVIYRNFFTKKQVDDYLELLKVQEFEEQQVVDDNGTEFMSKVRKANGTQIIANEHPASQSIFDTVQNLIPNLNFEYAEDIVALSYHPGGHYAPHHDYLEYPSEKEWDTWMKEYGNRFGTLIMMFKNAEKGGATVFPAIGAAVRANPGDAFFWFNAMANESQEDLSEHAGCPIYSGQKIISTIWVRMKNQPILKRQLSPGSISARYLLPGTV